MGKNIQGEIFMALFPRFQWSRRRLITALGAAVCLAALILGFLLICFGAPMPEGTSIGGLEVSNLSGWEARKALKKALEETLYAQDLAVDLPEQTLLLSPKDTGVKVDLTGALSAARQAGGEISLLPYLTVKESQFRTPLLNYAVRYDTQLIQPSWRLEGDMPSLLTEEFDPSAPGQTLVLTMGTPSAHLDVDGVYNAILEAYAQVIRLCREGAYSVAPEVRPEAIPDSPDVQEIYRECFIDPVNDSLDRETYAFVPGSFGRHFDREVLEAAIAAAQYGQTLTVPMVYDPPEILGEAAYFQDVLGEYETRHTDNENRNTNLRLMCQALDGVVVEPGEEFSFNGTVGERTKEKGYLPAPAYSGNRLVNSYGGGVCQGATTLYNCVLLADLEVTCRASHGAKVGYVPAGLDASVNWGTTDFRFRNNFHFPVKLQAEVSDGYVKMKILGTDEKDYYIKMETGLGEDETAFYARSYKCKYDKQTGELLSREVEAFSTYYKIFS